MRIAVFSDIHGNLGALENVLGQIKDKNVDRTVFLGDIFQRGHEEEECLNLLMDSDVICLKGNCELYAEHGVDVDPDVEYLREYYDGIRSKLTDVQFRFVQNMPLFYELEACGHKLFFAHFLFSDMNLPYPFLQLGDLKNGIFDKTCKTEAVTQYDLVLIGHSHKNFEKDNVVSVSAAGLEDASYLIIEVDEKNLSFERIDI